MTRGILRRQVDSVSVPFLRKLQVDACNEKYMNFGLEGGKKIVLDAEQARRDGPTVLRQHGIVFDRSVDLRLATNHALTAEEVIPGESPSLTVPSSVPSFARVAAVTRIRVFLSNVFPWRFVNALN